MPYLIDSDVMVDLTRGSSGAADYLDGLGDAWSISAVTCLELLAGARTQRETADLDLVLSGYRAIPPNEDNHPPSVLPHEDLRAFPRLHTPDALIAATALEEGLTLVSKKPRALPDDW